MKDEALFLHELRSPLARARTYGKLLADEIAAESADTLSELLLALEEMEAKIRSAEERLPTSR